MSQAVPVPQAGQGGVYQLTAAPCTMLVLLPLQRVNEENTRERRDNCCPPALHVLPTCLFHMASGGSGCASKRGLGAAVAAPLHNPIHMSSASLTTLSCIFSNKSIFLSWISFVLPKETWGAPGPPCPKEPTTCPGVPPCSPSEGAWVQSAKAEQPPACNRGHLCQWRWVRWREATGGTETEMSTDTETNLAG